ncbi:enhancer of polycomb homolog 1 isoform X2 [Lissotriton helveticus]
MSKLSFRARALDASKALPIFRCEDLPDLHEYASINRAVPQMPTGMEKEEESEHHLQRAISAQQVYGEKRDNMVIPVPEAESNIAYYESIYPGEFKMPKQLIHLQPFSLDAEQPDYDMDSEDEVFVNKLKKKMDIFPLQFEEMTDRLEKGSGQQAVGLQEAKLLLKEDDEVIREVYDYWIKKRKNCRAPSLIPVVKQEKRDGSSTNDPYVAFRRRTEKMQTRKNRKNEEVSYEKMLKLRRDLSRAVTILEMIKRREKSKRELLHLTLEIIEKRNNLGDYSGEIMSEVFALQQPTKTTYSVPIIPASNSSTFKHQETVVLKEFKVNKKCEFVRPKRKYEKKPKVLASSAAATSQQTNPAALSIFITKDLNQYDFPSSDEDRLSQVLSGSSEAEEENDPDGVYAFRRKAGCQYNAPNLDHIGNWPWCSPEQGGLGDIRYRYCLTTLTIPQSCVGLARRRLGRGGRVLLDRAHWDYDSSLHDMDVETLSSQQHPSLNQFANTSETNTSDRCFSTDLSQMLVNIKSCRWRHFRPRIPSVHDSNNTGFACKQIYRIGATHPGTHPISNSTRSSSTHLPFTIEQYQQHLLQLALMQKHQLSQIHLQQTNCNTTANHSQGFASRTLDSISAQFAASALVTSEQLTALRMKEDVVLGVGVNGVLQASGLYKGLHLSSTATAALVHTNQSSLISTGSALLQHSNIAQTSTPRSIPSFQVTSANTAAAQVLIGNSIRLTVPSSVATVNSINTLNVRHIPRTINSVPSSALKLAMTTNCQVPKLAGSSTLDPTPRENHEPEKSALNSIADNTVAMEVT